MLGRVEVMGVRSGFFRDRVKLRAIENCHVIYDSLLGWREFYMNEEETISLWVNRDMFLSKGDIVAFEAVCTPCNAFQFSWVWI